MGSLTRFTLNKTTITILAVIVGLVVLFAGYKIRLDASVQPEQIPIAIKNISATQQILSTDYEFVDASADFIKAVQARGTILKTRSEIDEKYVTTGTSIPAGGLFYSNQVVDKSQLPNAVFDDIPEGATLFSLNVDNNSTYGNSISPTDRIDLYVKYTNDSNKIVYGLFVESIEVLAVRDSSQNDIDGSSTGNSAKLLFAVNDDIYQLLSQASYISGLTIVPVPRNKAYTDDASSTVIKSTEIKDYIESKTSQPSY